MPSACFGLPKTKTEFQNAREVEVAQAAVAAHLAHGDTLGPCEGEGEGEQPVGDINLSVDNLNYGPYPVSGGHSAYQSVFVQNLGAADLAILARFLEGPDSSEFHIIYDTGQSSIAPEGQRVISIGFDPATEGDKQAYLTLVSDDPDEHEVSVSLVGKGIQ